MCYLGKQTKHLFFLSLGAMLFSPLPAIAEEVFLIQEKPDPKVLANLMYPQKNAEKQNFKLRGIRFTQTSPEESEAIVKEPAVSEQVANGSAENIDAAQQSISNQVQEKGMAVGFNIQFEVNSYELLPDTLPYLDSVGEMLMLEQTNGATLLIAGHADASGDADYNRELSKLRADSVASYITSKYQVETTRLKTVGIGEQSPIPDTDPYSGVNRRVEFYPE